MMQNFAEGSRGVSSDGAAPLPVEQLLELRSRFISSPDDTDLSSLRPVIARSWRRSLLNHVDPRRDPLSSQRTPQLDDQFLEAARPTLEGLLPLCDETQGYVALCDPLGTLAFCQGAFGTSPLGALPGLNVSEHLLGTNSDGTALQEGQAVQVWAGEHFNLAFTDTCCTSVPIHDPLRRTVRGVLSLTLPQRVIHTLDSRAVLLIVQGAAAEISAALAARFSQREQQLMSAYIIETRKRGSGAVIAIDERTTITSRAATQLLDRQDYPILEAYAKDLAGNGGRLDHELWLNNGRNLHLTVQPVSEQEPGKGSIIRISPIGAGEASGNDTAPKSLSALPEQKLTGIVGRSSVLHRAMTLAAVAIDQQLPCYIIGESGTGKSHFSQQIAAYYPGEREIFDSARYPSGTFPIDAVCAAIHRKKTVILHHVEQLAEADVQPLLRAIEGQPQPHIILTMNRIVDSVMPLIDSLRGIEINLPPLRMRREDVPQLAQHFLPDPAIKLNFKLISMLTAAEWPGNLTQLKDVITVAAGRAEGSELRTEHVTELHRRTLSRNGLTRLQRVELEEIRNAIRECGGNRLKAAVLLSCCPAVLLSCCPAGDRPFHTLSQD